MADQDDPFAGIDLSSLNLGQPQGASPTGAGADPFAGIDLSGLDLSGRTHPPEKPKQPPATTIEPRRAPIGGDESDLQKYAEMPWSEVAASGAKHLLPSAGTALAGVGHAIIHPLETAEALKQLGQGAYSKAAGALGVQQEPEEKARTEHLIDALGEHYTGTYGSMGGFKKALALDPFSVGMDVSVPLTMGASAAPGATGMVGRAASLAGKLGTVMDPVQASLAVAKGLGKAGGAGLRAAETVSTGVPQSLLKTASMAGSTTDPELRAAFLKYLGGNGDATELAMSAQKALRDIKAQKSAEYMQSKAGMASSSTPLQFDLIDQAIADARKKVSAIRGTFPEANQALDAAEAYVNSLRSEPASLHNLDNFDTLKQSIWDLRSGTSNSYARNALDNVYYGVRNTLVRHDPEYAKLMEAYTTGLNNTNDLTKTLGLGSNVAASSAIGKMLKATKTSNGQSLLDQIAATNAGKSVPYMLAGQALNAWHPGGARNLLEALLMYGSVVVHPSLAAGLLAQSPRVIGNLNYALGSAQRLGAPLATKPITYGASQLGETMGGQPQAQPVDRVLNTIKTQETGTHPAPYAAKNPVSSASGAYQFTDDTWRDLTKKYGIGTQYNRAADAPPTIQDAVAQRRVQEILTESGGDVSKVPLVWYTGNPKGEISPSALALNKGLTPEKYQRNWMQRYGEHAETGGRITRATGGRAGFDPEARAEDLMRAVETAKKQENAKTKPLLNIPDEAIVRALAVAKEAI